MKTLPAKHYFIALSLVGLLLFLLLSANQVLRTEAVKAAILEEKRVLAGEEVARAVDKVLGELNRVIVELSQWDEVHQQLSDPTYYVYWRETRQRNQEYIPDYVASFELYGEDLHALVKMANHPMPLAVPDTRLFLQPDSGQLYVFSEIVSRVPGEGAVGYLGIKVNFLEALNALNRFTLIQADSVNIERLDSLVLPNDIATYLDYQLIEVEDSSRLGNILLNTLREYFVLFAVTILIFYLMVSVLLIRPLRMLNMHIHDLRKGNRNYSETSGTFLPSIKEIATARQSLNNYQRELDSVKAELDNKNAELWELAHIDALTGINNRLAFDRDWNELLHLTRNTRLDVSLALFDCDFFKAINDTYGHEAGDKVIQSIARLIQGVLREGDSLYRIGGDEFVSIFVNCAEDEARIIALRCIAAVQNEAFEQLGIKETLKLSVGLAHASGDDKENIAELPRQADVAMYHAKGSTREKVVHYTTALEEDAYALVSSHITAAVLDAIENGTNMSIHYQPIVNTETRQVSHYEALVRINDPAGLITPADIFPVVARRRQEVELDKAVIRSILSDLASGHFPMGAGVAVNVSAALLALNDFCEQFSEFVPYLEQHPVIIEVTETNYISHLQHASECLQKLRENGFTIALDDFGSGYSSLRYLANMPVDIVKFDISMVRALKTDDRSRAMIADTAQLIHNAGYTLVAEGIEDEETLQCVLTLSPKYLQGYLFGYPQPLHELS